MAKTNGTTTKAPKVKETNSEPSKGLRAYAPYYLVAYNVLSALGWAYVLGLTITHITNLDRSQSSKVPETARAATSTLSRFLTSIPFLNKSPTLTSSALESKLPSYIRPVFRRATTAYTRIGGPVTVVQSAAVLEVVHVLLHLVKSALPTTVMQVSSRLYLVFGILGQFPAVRGNPLVVSMVFAWSATEIIRYSFYSGNLLGREVPFLTYLRYTTFYVLYPIGALSEAGLIYATLPSGSVLQYKTVYDFIRLVFTFIWTPGLIVMMSHMQAQRTKVLGPGLGYKGTAPAPQKKKIL